MNIQNLPLSKLVPSPANVRKTDRSNGIEQLAASIKALDPTGTVMEPALGRVLLRVRLTEFALRLSYCASDADLRLS
jgi:hypothetical protein